MAEDSEFEDLLCSDALDAVESAQAVKARHIAEREERQAERFARAKVLLPINLSYKNIRDASAAYLRSVSKAIGDLDDESITSNVLDKVLKLGPYTRATFTLKRINKRCKTLSKRGTITFSSTGLGERKLSTLLKYVWLNGSDEAPPFFYDCDVNPDAIHAKRSRPKGRTQASRLVPQTEPSSQTLLSTEAEQGQTSSTPAMDVSEDIAPTPNGTVPELESPSENPDQEVDGSSNHADMVEPDTNEDQETNQSPSEGAKQLTIEAKKYLETFLAHQLASLVKGTPHMTFLLPEPWLQRYPDPMLYALTGVQIKLFDPTFWPCASDNKYPCTRAGCGGHFEPETHDFRQREAWSDLRQIQSLLGPSVFMTARRVRCISCSKRTHFSNPDLVATYPSTLKTAFKLYYGLVNRQDNYAPEYADTLVFAAGSSLSMSMLESQSKQLDGVRQTRLETALAYHQLRYRDNELRQSLVTDFFPTLSSAQSHAYQPSSWPGLPFRGPSAHPPNLVLQKTLIYVVYML
eukprot:m.242602 g.242602  ORF g.242602 m.242602 type:complete len:519 (-) comp17455_c1_seq51:872-2428(-)